MNDTASWYGPETATFGDRVSGAREAAGMSQSDLARRLGVKLKTVRGWEDDLSEPRANKLQMLSGVLGVSLMWLLNGEGDGIEPPDETPMATPSEAEALLQELRQIREVIDGAVNRLGRIERRLGANLEEMGSE